MQFSLLQFQIKFTGKNGKRQFLENTQYILFARHTYIRVYEHKKKENHSKMYT